MAKNDKNTYRSQQFEDLRVWQEANKLTQQIYKHFGDNNDFGFRNQIQRATLSIMNNIAEGYERESQQELHRFLYIAKGSCGEVRSMLILAKELGYISEDVFDHFKDRSIAISKMLSSFIKKIESK